MNWQVFKKPIYLFTLRKIPVYLSPLWCLMVLGIGLVSLFQYSPIVSLCIVGFVFVSYFFVLVHEFGHAIAAQHYNSSVKSIHIYPFAGLASIENGLNSYPKRDFWVTLWGPLTNVAWCAIFAPLTIVGFYGFLPNFATMFFAACLCINVFLVLFNLIPVFPMDGGRIFKASIQMLFRVKPLKAAKITYYAGLFTGIPIAMFAFLYGFWLAAIMLFVCAIFFGKKELEKAEKIESLKVDQTFARGKGPQNYPKSIQDMVSNNDKLLREADDLLERTAKYDKTKRR